jgi:hypothetical protein
VQLTECFQINQIVIQIKSNMSYDKLPTLPTTIEDIDATNIRRVTLTRSGVAALFAQSSYDTGEKTLTENSTRPARDYRPPPAARSWLTPNSTTSNNPTSNSFQSTGPTVAAQRSSLFRYVIQRSSSFATTAVSLSVINTIKFHQLIVMLYQLHQ